MFEAGLKKGTPLTIRYTLSFQVGSLFYTVIHVNTSCFMHSSYVCLCTCRVDGISADSIAELHFLIPAVGPYKLSNTCNHGYVKNVLRKHAIRILQASCNKDQKVDKNVMPVLNGYTRY